MHKNNYSYTLNRFVSFKNKEFETDDMCLVHTNVNLTRMSVSVFVNDL